MSQVFFYLLILLLPVQLGKHFWPKESFVWGIRVDYLSPTVYLTDIIIFLMIGAWIIGKLKVPQELKVPRVSREWIMETLIIALLVVNCFLAKNQLVAFYKLLKIIEFGALVLYVKEKADIKDKILPKLLAISVFYSSVIAIWQFLKQGSIGGILWWLGERTFTAQTPGISQINFGGRLFLRPYATFPHPNVLGGFLTLILPILLASQGDALRGWQARKWWKMFFITTFFLGLIALFLTFSRTAILAFLIVTALMLLKSSKKKISKIAFLFLLITIYLLLVTKIQSPESVLYRQQLTVSALKMVRDQPIFGVGLNNFIVRLPDYGPPGIGVRFLQPVHNIYLLIVTETGIVGLVLFLWLIIKSVYSKKQQRNKMLHTARLMLYTILFLGLFDHYFLTLQQGQILLALLIGLCLKK